MNLLCWNCRGLGNQPTEQELGDMIRAQDPSVVFLAETWLDKARLEEVRVRLNLGGMIEVCRETRGGGIVIFWKKGIDFSLDTFSPNHIDGIVNKGTEDEWRFTGGGRNSKSSLVLVMLAATKKQKCYSMAMCR